MFLTFILALLVAAAAGVAVGRRLYGPSCRAMNLNDLITEIQQMAIKVSEIKAAVAVASKANREAFAEIGAKIADLNQQIKDLIEGNSDPSVTDEAFEADLRDLATDAQALADIVPGSPTPPAPPA